MINVFRKKPTVYIDTFFKINTDTPKANFAKQTSSFREKAALKYNNKKVTFIKKEPKKTSKKYLKKGQKMKNKHKGPFFREFYNEYKRKIRERQKLKTSKKSIPFSSKFNYTLHLERKQFISSQQRSFSTLIEKTNKKYLHDNENAILSKKFTTYRLPFLIKPYIKHFLFVRKMGKVVSKFVDKEKGFIEKQKYRSFIANKRKIIMGTTPFISLLKGISNKKTVKRKKLKRLFKIKRRFFSRKTFSKRRSLKFLLSRKVKVLRKRGRFKLFNSMRKKLSTFRIYRKTYKRLPRKLRPMHKYLQARSVFFFRFRQYKGRRRKKPSFAYTKDIYFSRYLNRKIRGLGAKRYAKSLPLIKKKLIYSYREMLNKALLGVFKKKKLAIKLNTFKKRALRKIAKDSLSALKKKYFPAPVYKRGRKIKKRWKLKYPLLWRIKKIFIKKNTKNDISYSFLKSKIKNRHLKKKVLNIRKRRYYNPKLFLKRLSQRALSSFLTIMKKVNPFTIIKKEGLVVEKRAAFSYGSSALKHNKKVFLLRFPFFHPLLKTLIKRKKARLFKKLKLAYKKAKSLRLRTRNRKLRLRRYKKPKKHFFKRSFFKRKFFKKLKRRPYKRKVILKKVLAVNLKIPLKRTISKRVKRSAFLDSFKSKKPMTAFMLSYLKRKPKIKKVKKPKGFPYYKRKVNFYKTNNNTSYTNNKNNTSYTKKNNYFYYQQNKNNPFNKQSKSNSYYTQNKNNNFNRENKSTTSYRETKNTVAYTQNKSNASYGQQKQKILLKNRVTLDS